MSYVSMETRLPDDENEQLWQKYDEGFAEINRKSPFRQSVHKDEFLRIIEEPTVFKAVLRDDTTDGLLAAAIWSGNLDVFPWLSKEYFAEKYPADFNRNTVFYTVATLSLSKRAGHMTKIMFEMARQVGEMRGRMLFDLCSELVEIDWQNVIVDVATEALGEPLVLEELGAQRYFTVSFATT